MPSKPLSAFLFVVAASGFGSSALAGPEGRPEPASASAPPAALVRGCPAEMVRVQDYCIDRWEISLVDRDTDLPLSPYYPPHPLLLRRAYDVWQVERENFGDESARRVPLPDLPPAQLGAKFAPMAVSRADVVPQGYLTYHLARDACSNAGKRLCTEEEWVGACEGARQRKFPYGSHYVRGRCNVHRALHPAHILHGNSSIGHTDPRLNLVMENGTDPLLRLTGGTAGCASRWGEDRIYDMVGNLDEWIEDEGGVFVGGFYSRMTTQGCRSRISSHAPSYYDYSLGARCCSRARIAEQSVRKVPGSS